MKKKLLNLTIVLFLAQFMFAQNTEKHNFKSAKNLEIFNTIYKYLDLYYVDTLNSDVLIGNAVNYMLATLDPYTSYYTSEESKDLKETITGKFAGIGSVVRYSAKYKAVVIDEPTEDMPAAKVGLKKGDVILSINDSSMIEKSVSYVSSKLRGDVGTKFNIKIKRPYTNKIMTFRVTRQLIETPSVPYFTILKNDIGYIQLSSFKEDCSKDIRKTFLDLKSKGMKKFILDLRNNGGGSELEAVKIVNILVGKNKKIVSNKGKIKSADKVFETTVAPLDTIIPTIVLVNNYSASASEITSGALQDLDRAVIVGEQTYGKGLVQIPLDLPFNSTMKLTTGKYYLPSGRCIQAIKYKHGVGGYVEHIPDSIAKVFYTQKGRPVKDSGGITPDVKISADSISNISYYLTVVDTTEIVNDFVYDYINTHPTIASPAEFVLTDNDFNEFKSRVLKSNFTYDKETEKQLKVLMDYAKFEGYYEDAKEEFANLETKLKHNLERDLDFNKQQLSYILANKIISTYYYHKGSIEYSTRFDKQLDEACRILNSSEEYYKLLNVNK